MNNKKAKNMSQKEELVPRWYVVHTYSGYENKVKTDLEKTIKNRELEEYFFDIIVPMEEQIEIVSQVDRLFLGIDEIEKQYVLESERSKQLQKSVLQSAYSGQLSSPLPKDSSIPNLLEEIIFEKSNNF